MGAPLWVWKVAIFDDEPVAASIEATRTRLESHGVRVGVFGGRIPDLPRLSFLLDEFVRTSHLHFVDMSWQLPDVNCRRVPAVDEASPPGKDWLAEFAKAFELSPEGVPGKQKIPNDYMGFWIAAALSHANRHASICFFTGEKDVLEGIVVGGFARFERLQLKVTVKPSDAMVDEDLFARLEPLQRSLLASSYDAFEWLVGGVLVPLLVGKCPTSRNVGPLWPDDPPDCEWSLTAASFFPQWEVWRASGGSVLPKLARLFARPPFRQSSSRRRALESIRHDLDRIRRGGRGAGDDLDPAIGKCFELGFAGERVERLLSSARERWPDGGLEEISEARRLVVAVAANSLTQLDDLCLEFGGEFACAPEFEVTPALTRGGAADLDLPFDNAHLRRVAEALQTNARDRGCGPGEWRLDAYLDRNGLAIEFVDRSPGFRTFGERAIDAEPSAGGVHPDAVDDFAAKVERSVAERGIFRGFRSRSPSASSTRSCGSAAWLGAAGSSSFLRCARRQSRPATGPSGSAGSSASRRVRRVPRVTYYEKRPSLHPDRRPPGLLGAVGRVGTRVPAGVHVSGPALREGVGCARRA